MGFKRFVTIVEVVVGITALAFVVALFANEPGGESGAQTSPGASIYAANCATCHGNAGQGGVGPVLAGKVVSKFPDAADQIAIVKDGRGGMPSFGGDLSDAQIAQVVEYTRTELGR
ncbi:MAG TPA: cytochrome c [Acidimicrobiia bacterium]|jgi:cytochrome c551